jgi:hypothetical protein
MVNNRHLSLSALLCATLYGTKGLAPSLPSLLLTKNSKSSPALRPQSLLLTSWPRTIVANRRVGSSTLSMSHNDDNDGR